jgi:membrane-associated phospholipid phosphatase
MRPSQERGHRPWPVVAGRLLGGAAAVYLALVAAGLGLTHTALATPLRTADLNASTWFVTRRTPTMDFWTVYYSGLSNTNTAVVVAVVMVAVLALMFRRWQEPVVLASALLGELFIFLLVTATVHRPRPPVGQMDPAPPTSSFPSGHTGAAVALYVTFAVLAWRYLSRRHPALGWLRVVVVAVLAVLPVLVGYSRLYRAMHYPSDVAGGALAGGLWVAIVVSTLLPRAPRASSDT